MKKLLCGALLGAIAACGGSEKEPVDTKIIVTPDSATSEVCNVVANSGCASGEKCTWIIDVWTGANATGHIGCAPAGGGALGAACKIGTGGMMPTGSDDCGPGLYCNSGVCKTVCDPNNDACGDNLACATYVNSFANDGEDAKAGVCDPTCSPLTQKVDGTNAPNCGGELDTATTTAQFPAGYPRRGCYGFWAEAGASRFSCAGSGDKANVHDVVISVPLFINKCAPGYFPGLTMGTGTMKSVCSAHCNPGDAFQGAPANQFGGVKLASPDQDAKATCADRGATGSWDCIRGFIFETTDAGQLQPTEYSDLGVCMQWPRFTSSQTMMPLKACAELPKADTAMDDEAWQFGCRPLMTHTSLRSGKIQMPATTATLKNYFRPAYPMTLE